MAWQANINANVTYEGESNEDRKICNIYKCKYLRFSFDSPL